MHNLKDGGPAIETGMDWTVELVDNGFVFDWVTDFEPWVAAAFERDLVPCIRVQECNGGCTPNPGYAGNAAYIVLNYKVNHPQYLDRLVYFQLWNEPNDPRDYVAPDVFADYMVAAHSAVHQAEDNIAQSYPDVAGTLKTMTPGQNGASWWDQAFTHNPNAKYAFDVWGTHPYPESYPPWYNHHDGVSFFNKSKTIDSYLLDLDVVASNHGGVSRRGFPVMITETAYGDHLGIAYEGYPKTDRQMAADYNVLAFGTFWYQWPEIVAVHPFILANISWDHFGFVHWYSGSQDTDSDGILEPTDPYPQYTAVKDLRQDLRNGQILAPARLTPYRGPVGAIQGTTTSGGQALEYVTLYTDGYEFGNVSLFDGGYRVENVPAATYTLTAKKYGYGSVSQQVTVTSGGTATANFNLPLIGKLHKGIYFEDCISGVYCSGECPGCNSSGSSFVGQTFRTPADVEFIKFVAAKVAVGYPTEIKFSLRVGGPSGALVPGSDIYRLIEYADAGTMTGAEYPDGQEPSVQPNTTYFMKVERSAGGSIFGFMADTNPYPDGTAYLDYTPYGGWDMKAVIRGMTGYAGPTPTPQPTNTPGGPTPSFTPTPSTPPAPPVVSNPSFESSLGTTWQLWIGSGSNGDALERDWLNTNAKDGVWALAVKGIGTGGKGAFQYVNNNWTVGRTYRATVWARNLANTNINYCIGYKLGNTGSGGGTSATYGSTVVHPSGWTQASVEFTYSGSSGVTIYLRAVNDGHSERAGFDLVEITDIGGGGPQPTATNTPAAQPTPTPTSAPFSGLQNGNMEGGFHNEPDGDHQVANSWTRFTLSGFYKCGGYWHPANHSPDWSQAFWESNWVGGIYQQVSGTSSGQNYTGSVWVKGDADVRFWIGIDPTGGTNAGSGNVQWSSQSVPGGTWTQISKQVQASGSAITLFVKAQNPAGYNKNAWIDDAAITTP